METPIHKRKQRLVAKRQNLIEAATVTIKAVADRRIDPYEGWQQVCGTFQANAGLGLPELKQFVEIEGADPNSTLPITEEFRDAIWRRAVQFLRARYPQVEVADFIWLMQSFVAKHLEVHRYCRDYFELMTKRMVVSPEEDKILQQAYGDADDFDDVVHLEYTIDETQLRQRVSRSLEKLRALGHAVP